MRWFISHQTLRSGFLQAVEEESGQRVSLCYQCGKCSAGCPICPEMDYTPNQIIRMVQLGMKEVVLSSRTIWLCSSCETCTTRCPREVELARVMDALRRLAYREGVVAGEKDVPLFNKLFLKNIRSHGRAFEFGLIRDFNLRSRHLLRNVSKGPRMFLKGRITPLPHKSIKGIREVFRRVEEVEKK